MGPTFVAKPHGFLRIFFALPFDFGCKWHFLWLSVVFEQLGPGIYEAYSFQAQTFTCLETMMQFHVK